MSILEDCQDASIVSKDDLLNTCYLLEAWGQDEDGGGEGEGEGQEADFDYLARTVYWQLVDRSHELDSEEIQAVSAIFQRLFILRAIEEPLPRLSDEIRA